MLGVALAHAWALAIPGGPPHNSTLYARSVLRRDYRVARPATPEREAFERDEFSYGPVRHLSTLRVNDAFAYEGGDITSYVSPTGAEYAIVANKCRIHVVDVSDPRDPVAVTSVDRRVDTDVDRRGHPADCDGLGWVDVRVFRRHLYVTGEGYGRLRGVEVYGLHALEERRALTHLGVFGDSLAHAHNSQVDDDGYLYLFGGMYSLSQVIDGWVNPLFDADDWATFWTTACDGGPCEREGFTVFDLAADPVSPPLVVHFTDRGPIPRLAERPTTAWFVHDGTVRRHADGAKYLYAAVALPFGPQKTLSPDKAYSTDFFRSAGLGVLDVTDMAAPRWVSFLSPPDTLYPHDVSVSHDLTTAYLHDELNGLPGYGGSWDKLGGLRLIDVSDVARPAYLGDFYNPFPSQMHQTTVVGDRLYQANHRSGLCVWNVTRPRHPTMLSYHLPAREAGIAHITDDDFVVNALGDFRNYWGLSVLQPSGTVVANDRHVGLQVFEETVPNPCIPSSCFVDGRGGALASFEDATVAFGEPDLRRLFRSYMGRAHVPHAPTVLRCADGDRDGAIGVEELTQAYRLHVGATDRLPRPPCG